MDRSLRQRGARTDSVVTAALAVGPQPIDYAPYNWASIYWLCTVGGFLLAFLPVELWQIAAGHPENTLSAQVWRLGDVIANQPITQWAPEHWMTFILALLLFGWLIVHFGVGWLR